MELAFTFSLPGLILVIVGIVMVFNPRILWKIETKLYMNNYDKFASIVKECGFNELCYYVKRKEYRYVI